PRAPRANVCERAEGRERVPPILDAVRACRAVLLPRAQAAVEGILAAGEDLGLKSPSAGRHLSVKSWGCGGKARVRFPLKNRNSRFFQQAANRAFALYFVLKPGRRHQRCISCRRSARYFSGFHFLQALDDCRFNKA